MHAASEGGMQSNRAQQRLRYEAATQLLETHKHHRMLDWPLWRWLQSDHLHTPAAWLDQTLRETLQVPFSEIAATRGIGRGKIEKLLLALDRARAAMEQGVSSGVGNVNAAPRDNAVEGFGFPYRVARDAHFLGAEKAPIWELDDRDWEAVGDLIRHHGLECFMLGRFASSLRKLHRSLWHEKISTFTQRPFSQLCRAKGYGPVRLGHSVSQVLSLAFVLNALPAQHDMRVALLPATITQANQWLALLQLSEQDRIPDARSIREDLLEPLLVQVACDTNTRVSEAVRRRIGDGSQSRSLQEIANAFGVTPERIRTLIQRATFVFHVRWPEGRYLLQGACAELSARGDATEQRQLLQRIHQTLFGTHSKGSRQIAPSTEGLQIY